MTRPRRMTMTRTLLLAGLAAVVAAPTARGDNPEIVAVYQKVDPKGDFAFKWKEKGTFTKPAGTLHWGVPRDQFGTSGLDREFDSYCAEPLVGITAGKSYKFEVQDPATPAAFNLPDTEDGRKEAFRRASYVRELYGRYYPAVAKSADPDDAKAFQIAVWKLSQESAATEEGTPNLDLFTGNFQADYPDLATAPAYVQKAQQLLTGVPGDATKPALSGKDAVFYENESLKNRELVRLQGIATDTGEVAQSQFAMRYAPEAAVNGLNGALAAAGGPGGGAPSLPFGGGGSGLPGGGRGAISGFPGGGGSGSGGSGTTPTVSQVPNSGVGTGSGTPPGSPTPNVPISNTPPTPQTPNPGVGPPTTGPGTGGTPPGSTPPNVPGGGPNPPTNPVPAPPAVVLALSAVGLLAGRRVVGRKAGR